MPSSSAAGPSSSAAAAAAASAPSTAAAAPGGPSAFAKNQGVLSKAAGKMPQRRDFFRPRPAPAAEGSVARHFLDSS